MVELLSSLSVVDFWLCLGVGVGGRVWGGGGGGGIGDGRRAGRKRRQDGKTKGGPKRGSGSSLLTRLELKKKTTILYFYLYNLPTPPISFIYFFIYTTSLPPRPPIKGKVKSGVGGGGFGGEKKRLGWICVWNEWRAYIHTW